MLGSLIKDYLTEKGVKQSFLAEKANVSKAKISRICNHDIVIDAITYKKICDALGLPQDYFFDKLEEQT